MKKKVIIKYELEDENIEYVVDMVSKSIANNPMEIHSISYGHNCIYSKNMGLTEDAKIVNTPEYGTLKESLPNRKPPLGKRENRCGWKSWVGIQEWRIGLMQLVYVFMFVISVFFQRTLADNKKIILFFVTMVIMFVWQFIFVSWKMKNFIGSKGCLLFPITLVSPKQGENWTFYVYAGIAALYLMVIDLMIWVACGGFDLFRLSQQCGTIPLPMIAESVICIMIYLVGHFVFWGISWLSDQLEKNLNIFSTGGLLALLLVLVVTIQELGFIILTIGIMSVFYCWWATYYTALQNGKERIFKSKPWNKAQQIWTILFWVAVFICIYSTLIYYLIGSGENQNAYTGIESINTVSEKIVCAIYYCVSTITTLGYGDIHPNQMVSRLLAIFIVLTGIWLTVIFVGAVMGSGSGVSEDCRPEKCADMQTNDEERET